MFYIYAQINIYFLLFSRQWGNWQDGYKQMKYTGGAGCWNGPSRSTLVSPSSIEEKFGSVMYIQSIKSKNKFKNSAITFR